MNARTLWCLLVLALGLAPASALAQDPPAPLYSLGKDDPGNLYDAPLPGFTGPHGEGAAPQPDGLGGFFNAGNYVNPLFLGWAAGVTTYARSDTGTQFNSATLALGPVTGNEFDAVSLGDLPASGGTPGAITLSFTRPISNLPGADLAVFENALIATNNTGGVGIGGVWAELAYVEVSSNGVNFARFPSRSRTAGPVGMYGSIDPRNVFNLAGKHVNGGGSSWGTPFDLADLEGDPLVTGGQVNLAAITHVRVVDVPGRGTFLDAVGAIIYDAWQTFGSGGFDLEALGAISVKMEFTAWETQRGLTQAPQRGELADPDRDAVPNLLEYAFAMLPTRWDREHLPHMESSAGGVALTFRRDLRAIDLVYEVEASSNLTDWAVLARSTAGGDLLPVAPFSPVVDDIADSHITGVEVIRRHTVRDVYPPASAPQRYLRVKVTREVLAP